MKIKKLNGDGLSICKKTVNSKMEGQSQSSEGMTNSCKKHRRNLITYMKLESLKVKNLWNSVPETFVTALLPVDSPKNRLYKHWGNQLLYIYDTRATIVLHPHVVNKEQYIETDA